MKTKRLDAAVILNISPDHLDRYKTFADYAAAKIKIRDCLLPNHPFFISRQIGQEWKIEGEVFNPTSDFTPWTHERVAAISALRYIQLGVPERENVQAAYAVCAQLGVSNFDFCRGLETFRKPAHRIEWVGEKEGVAFYNDSKATNIDSVAHAMSLFTGPLILLAGGVDKGASYAPWIASFQEKVKMIIAFGQAAAKMELELSASFPFFRVATMEEALLLATKEAKRGMSILLSPGCSSYDQFRNYEHRGDEFKRLVRGML
jgi:UDP-N-acetylmuramoylalanine--D-glutamate ligase